MSILSALLASWNVSGLLVSFAFLVALACGVRDFPLRAVLVANSWGTAVIFGLALARL